MKTKYHSTLSAVETRSHDGTQNNSIRRKRSAGTLRRFFLASVFVLSISSAKAQCPQGWDVMGKWTLIQGSTRNAMELYQTGTRVYGKASFQGMTERPTKNVLGIVTKFGANGTINGSVEGTVTGDNFYIKIAWTNNTTGVYNGKFSPQGQLTGTGYEIRSPSKTVNWFSDKEMKCAAAAVEPTKPTPARPKPIKSSGHMRTTTSPTPTPAG